MSRFGGRVWQERHKLGVRSLRLGGPVLVNILR